MNRAACIVTPFRGDPLTPTTIMVVNRHERHVAAPVAEVWKIVSSLAGEDDEFWPRRRWPAMRLDRGLAAGAEGGHGPIGYVVDVVDPERAVRFRFTRPVGFAGHHTFEVEPEAGGTALRHELVMRVRGIARLTWPLVFRPLHDALIEDALDRATARLEGRVWDPRPLDPYVRLLRRILRPRPEARI